MHERSQRSRSDRGLLLQALEWLDHLHRMVHYLVEVAGSGGDQAAIDAITEKLKASGDAKEQVVEKTENT